MRSFPNTYRFLHILRNGNTSGILFRTITQDIRRHNNPVTGTTQAAIVPYHYRNDLHKLAQVLGCRAIINVRLK